MTLYALILATLLTGSVGDIRTRGGTVVAVVFSQYQIVIAADSRVNSHSENPNTATTFDDTGCKILRFGKNVVFASSGKYTIEWRSKELMNSFAVARQTYDKLLVEKSLISAKQLADQWASRVEEVYSVQPPQLIDKWCSSGSDRLTLGLFAVGKANANEAVIAIVRCNEPTALSRVGHGIIILKPEKYLDFTAFGETSIVGELRENQTERARAERKKWSGDWLVKYSKTVDERIAIRLVDLTIKWHPEKWKVGGPIDAIALAPDGNARWLQRKATCADK